MEQKGEVRFIRKNGRVIPIRQKGNGSGGKGSAPKKRLVRPPPKSDGSLLRAAGRGALEFGKASATVGLTVGAAIGALGGTGGLKARVGSIALNSATRGFTWGLYGAQLGALGGAGVHVLRRSARKKNKSGV